MQDVKWRCHMKLRPIHKFVLAVALVALAACLSGCHGVSW